MFYMQLITYMCIFNNYKDTINFISIAMYLQRDNSVVDNISILINTKIPSSKPFLQANFVALLPQI